jgi:hypothetical protein
MSSNHIQYITSRNPIEIAKTNKAFDKSIKFAESYIVAETLEIEKKIFNLAIDLSISDWRAIRSGDYWDKKDAIRFEYAKQKFTLSRIEGYLQYKRRL